MADRQREVDRLREVDGYERSMATRGRWLREVDGYERSIEQRRARALCEPIGADHGCAVSRQAAMRKMTHVQNGAVREVGHHQAVFPFVRAKWCLLGGGGMSCRGRADCIRSDRFSPSHPGSGRDDSRHFELMRNLVRDVTLSSDIAILTEVRSLHSAPLRSG